MASAAAEPGRTRSELNRTVKLIGRRRALLTVLLLLVAVLAARLTWHAHLAADAERALYDFRVWLFTPAAARDDRIVLVTYTDTTLESTGKYSPLDRGLLARALTNLDALGPKAIGIDILVDQPQPEDEQLVAALRGMKTPTYVAFAREATNEGSMLDWQESYLRRFMAAVQTDKVRPASIRFEVDKDGVIRSWPRPQRGDPPTIVTRLSGRTAPDNDRSIAFRRPADPEAPVFLSIPVDTFDDPAVAQMVRSQIAGKYVLLGGDISDVDRFDTPETRLNAQATTGLTLHATMLAQMLDDAFPPRVSSAWSWFFAILVVLVGSATGYRDLGALRGSLVIGAELLAIAALPFALQWAGVDTQFLPAFGWLVGWTIAFSAASAAARGVGSDQRRFAQSALGRYLPPEVAKDILRDPERLNLSGERRTIYALFSDIEGFTKMTHSIPPEQTATILNAYLDRMSNIVLAHGGTIDKFVGDAVVAFWGAPISRDDDGEMALKTAMAMAHAGNEFSVEAAASGAIMGRTRVGVHRGEAIIGNFGGEGRIQYTALGDVMNTAARLEGANKSLETRSLVSAEAASGVDGIVLRPMGRVAVRGRATPITVLEPNGDVSAQDSAELARLIEAFDAGEPSAADALEEYVAARAGDAALANLVYRLRAAGPGGCYALD